MTFHSPSVPPITPTASSDRPHFRLYVSISRDGYEIGTRLYQKGTVRPYPLPLSAALPSHPQPFSDRPHITSAHFSLLWNPISPDRCEIDTKQHQSGIKVTSKSLIRPRPPGSHAHTTAGSSHTRSPPEQVGVTQAEAEQCRHMLKQIDISWVYVFSHDEEDSQKT